jgi:hypothetical protein
MRHWKTAFFAVFAAAPLFTVMAVGATAQASSAVSARPGATSHAIMLTAKGHTVLSFLKGAPAKAQHQSTVVKLSPAQCQAAKAAHTRMNSDAIPMKKCEIGVGLALRPASGSRTISDGWYTYTGQLTACWGDQAHWGGKNGSFTCGEGYIQLTYQFATNGSWLNLHWESPGDAATRTFSLSETWQGVTGNNTSYMVPGANWNWGDVTGSGTVELRAYNRPCGGFKVCATAAAYWQG